MKLQLILYANQKDYNTIKQELEATLDREKMSYLFSGVCKTNVRKPDYLFLWQVFSGEPYFSVTDHKKEVHRAESVSGLVEFVKKCIVDRKNI